MLFELDTHVLFFPVDRLHLDEVDDPFKILFGTDVHLHRNRRCAEALLHLANNPQEIRSHTVHLVDEGNTRHSVLVRLAPDCL